MRISTAGKQPSNIRQKGYSYVMLLAAIVVTGIVLGVADVQTSFVLKREREEELLYRGIAYQKAIRSYYENGKPVKSYPRSLEDLLKDPRVSSKRHIRAIYRDPMVHGNSEWRLIRSPDGGISGVASTSKDAPLKRVNFPPGLEKLEKSKSYEEWIFEYVPLQASKPLVGYKRPQANTANGSRK